MWQYLVVQVLVDIMDRWCAWSAKKLTISQKDRQQCRQVTIAFVFVSQNSTSWIYYGPKVKGFKALSCNTIIKYIFISI